MRASVAYLADLVDEAFGCYAGLTGRALSAKREGQTSWTDEDWVEPLVDQPGVTMILNFTQRPDGSVEMQVSAIDSENEENKVVRSVTVPP